MKNEEKIRKYLDGELTGEELLKFEEEINNSSELKRTIDSYKNTLNQYRRFSNPDIQNSYFVNIIPEFRERIKKKKESKLKPVFVLGSVSLVIISLLVIFIFNKDREIMYNDNIVLQDIESEELNSYVNNYSRDFNSIQLTEVVEYDSLFNSMILNELNINGNSGDYFADVTGNEFYTILDELSEEEIDGIYNALISQKIY